MRDITAQAISAAGMERLQQLRSRIAASSCVKVALLDHEGNPAGDPPDIGAEVLQSLLERCARSGRGELHGAMKDGLACAAQPVFVNGALACTWVISGFVYVQDAGKLPGTESGAPIFNEASLRALLDMTQSMTADLLELERESAALAEQQESARELVMRDRLLGIPNDLWLEQDIAQGEEFKHLIVFDIQDLRKINDIYGRGFGDALLRAILSYIEDLHIPGGRIYRVQSADFAVLMGSTFSDDTPRMIAQKLHNRCLQPWVLNIDGVQQDIFISANICALPVSEALSMFHNLQSAVEHTMEIARKGESVVMFEDVADENFRDRIKLELSLRRAVRENMDGFYVVYQPIVDPGVAVWHGVEALCRWRSSEHGFVSPAEFIPIAESCGLIGAIGLWVLEQAISQTKIWGLDESDRFILEVNLSPIQLVDPDLDRTIYKILRKYDYPPHKLCLEVTESNELNFSTHTLRALGQLNEIGVVIALDDFGTGYASFSSLHKLPVGILKTDRSMINGMESDAFLQRMFEAMVKLAHGSGMKIVAEGVETSIQAQLLLKQGADYFQGFLFSKPLEAAQIETQLQNFFTPSNELVSMGYARLDLSELSDESGGYELTPALYKLLNRCMHVLFYEPDGDSAIEQVLALVGEALEVSRTYVFLRERNGSYSNTHEWCAPGIPSEKSWLQQQFIERISPVWIQSLRESGLLVASDIRMLDDGAFEVLKEQGILAVVEIPLYRNGDFYGFVGFDDCKHTHAWTREEVQMLHTLTSIISSTFGRMELQHRVAHDGERLENMLNSMDTMIYVSDLDTHEVLFANEAMQLAYGGDPTGSLCWEAVHNKGERCEFCPIEELRRKTGQSIQWEDYNEYLGKFLRYRNSIIRWEGNQKVHFCYIENITEQKQQQKQLETFASTDMLTATLNRASFEQAAVDRLALSMKQRENATIAFVDIDGLKAENDLYGHAAGDELICDVVQALRSNIRSTDLMGRWGGDEFVILFPNCSAHNASFSYGLASTDETREQDASECFRSLINLSDQRMMTHKRKHKKTR